MSKDLFAANRLGRTMLELGVTCAADEKTFNGIVSQFLEVDEQAVAEAMAVMASSTATNASGDASAGGAPGFGAAADSKTWNATLVIDTLKARNPGLSWTRVVERWDQPGFSVPDMSAFLLLLNAYKRATQEPFPLKAVIGRVWANAAGQLSFLRHAVLAPPEVFSFEAAERKQPPLEGLHGGKSPVGTPNQAWLSIDLLETLCGIGEANPGLMPALAQVLEQPLKQCPEVLLVGMASLEAHQGSALLRQVYAALLITYLSNHPNSFLVMHKLWAVNKQLVLNAIMEWFAADASHISRILDICQELKALNIILDNTSVTFAVELAALAARREYLHLERWLNERTSRDSTVLQAVLKFLDSKLSPGPDGSPAGAQPGRINVSPDVLKTMLTFMQSALTLLPPDMVAQLRRLHALAVQQQPALAAVLGAAPTAGTAANGANAAGGEAAFASDVEAEANVYFQKLYGEQMSVEEVVGLMRSFKASGAEARQEVFACMVHNLFDEYRFFYRYPDKELRITASLFGQLIATSLVSSVALGIAMRCVMDALKRPPGSKMFAFGLDALRQFRPQVHNYPQFCTHVLSLPGVKEADPELYAHIGGIVKDSGAAGAGGPHLVLGGPGGGAGGGAGAGGDDEHGGGGGGQPMALLGALFGKAGPGDTSRLDQMQLGGAGAGGTAAAAGGGAAEAHAESMLAAVLGGGGDKGAVGGGNAAAAALLGKKGGPVAAAVAAERASDSGGDSLTRSNDASLAERMAASTLVAGPRDAEANARPGLSTVNTESLDTAAEKYTDFVSPPEAVSDKLHFLMNNISASTVEAKAGEVRDSVVPRYVSWFANYMVVKRAAQEANFHALYVSLLDRIGDKELCRVMVRTTLYYVRVLLDSERIIKESNERTLLKNLGVWLGLLTFAKNKPILAKDLDLKHIILDAYRRGRMLAVMPFVKSVLETCRGSKVFTHTNPMVAGILSLLAEIHGMKGLKMNIVFSIELAFKAFELTASDDRVRPSELLKSVSRETMQNPDWGIESLPAPPPPPSLQQLPSAEQQKQLGGITGGGMTGGGGMTAAQLQMQGAAGAAFKGMVPPGAQGPQGGADMQPGGGGGAGAAAAGGAPGGGAAGGVSSTIQAIDQGLFANLHAYVQINPSLGPVLSDRLALKRVVPIAVDRAVGEIIMPVVERSCTIACYTTYELVTKDFAMEGDEGRMRKAAHLMVSSLAGSLALVTCKDPLRVSLANQLRQMLAGAAVEAAVLESAITLVVGDNLELGCTLIERAATDKAIRDIDKSLAAAYEARQKARSVGQPFYDLSAFHGRFPASLPEGLRPKPGLAISMQQQRVYEDFARIPRTAAAAAAMSPAGPTASQPGAPGGVPQAGAAAAAPGGPVARPGMAPGALLSANAGNAGMDMVGGGADKLMVAAAAAAAAAAAGGEQPQQQAAGVGGGGGGAALVEKYLSWQAAADVVVAKDASGLPVDNAELQVLITELNELVLSFGPAHVEEVGCGLGKRILKHLWDGSTKLHYTFHVTCLEVLLTLGVKRLPSELTALFVAIDDERKFSKDIGELLLRVRLFSMPELDAHLAKVLGALRSHAATDWLVHVVKTCMLRDPPFVTYAELFNSLDVLAKLAARSPGNEALLQLLDQARRATTTRPGASAQQQQQQQQQPGAGAAQQQPPGGAEPRGYELPAMRDKADPPGLREQCVGLFEEWLRTLAAQGDARPALGYLSTLRQAGLLKVGDETSDRFLRLLMELAVAHCLNSETPAQQQQQQQQPPPAGLPPPGSLSFMATDAFVKLVVQAAHTGGGEPLVARVLQLLVSLVKRDADERLVSFNGRPYMRILLGLIVELPQPLATDGGGGHQAVDMSSSSSSASGVGLAYLHSIGLALHSLQPLQVPGFAFGWLELVGSRQFMPKLLLAPGRSGWPLFEGLLTSLLRFLDPFLRQQPHGVDLPDSVRGLYRGALRLLLVLLHDFPEFLCAHHVRLVEAIPPTCIQVRNLVLSAFPAAMRLPDPFTPNLKVDLLPEIGQPPRLAHDPDRSLPEPLRAQLDAYLRSRTPMGLGAELAKRLALPPLDARAAGTSVNVPLLNALVLGIAKRGEPGATPSMAAMDLLVQLVGGLDSEGRYQLLNALANQLRYPNSHTHYFSCALLFLFGEAKGGPGGEALQEQITRVLLERLIVNRPHPWGLLITFIELIKNPRYNFWQHSFTRCAPEVERLFESVARSCALGSGGAGGAGGAVLGGPPQAAEAQAGGGDK